MKIWEKIKQRPLLYVLLLSLVLRIIFLFVDYPLWWDSYVYVNMGKYIFSAGKLGIWESFRPLIHPFILGIFWKLGLTPLIWGKILDTVFSLMAIYLTYKIAEKIFNRKIAVITSLTFSLTPAFILINGLILTEPLAITLGLLGVWFALNRISSPKIFLAGFFLGLSFMTKFPQGILFGAVGLALLLQKDKWRQKIKILFFYTLGFSLTVIPYLLLNHHLYGNAFTPFTAGSWIVTTATWLYGSGIFFYFTHFFLQTPIYLFFFWYLYHFSKTKGWHDYRKLIIVLIPVLTIAYFLYVPRKEIRYLTTILPFMVMTVAYALNHFYTKIKHHPQPVITAKAFIILCTIFILVPLPHQLQIERAPTFDNELKSIVSEKNITGLILTSDPALVSIVDLPLVTLDNMDFAPQIFEREKHNYDLLFINYCDFNCPPNDETCQKAREDLLLKMHDSNEELFSKQFKFNNTGRICTYKVYLPKQHINNISDTTKTNE